MAEEHPQTEHEDQAVVSVMACELLHEQHLESAENVNEYHKDVQTLVEACLLGDGNRFSGCSSGTRALGVVDAGTGVVAGAVSVVDAGAGAVAGAVGAVCAGVSLGSRASTDTPAEPCEDGLGLGLGGGGAGRWIFAARS